MGRRGVLLLAGILIITTFLVDNPVGAEVLTICGVLRPGDMVSIRNYDQLIEINIVADSAGEAKFENIVPGKWEILLPREVDAMYIYIARGDDIKWGCPKAPA